MSLMDQVDAIAAVAVQILGALLVLRMAITETKVTSVNLYAFVSGVFVKALLVLWHVAHSYQRGRTGQYKRMKVNLLYLASSAIALFLIVRRYFGKNMNVKFLMVRFALGLAAQILVLGWVMDWDNEFETIIAIELVFTAMAFLPLVRVAAELSRKT